ncbi:MAG TPA: CGNR zinc finger domain-containing protein [Solirubrobacterales bacterium]|nr:CGNR zinc finger domain-containing protein [Solirubrobacterales bacterium]
MSTALNKAVEGEAEFLVEFVNTRDVEEGTDTIGSPEGLTDWIADRTGEYLPDLDGDDHARALALRESLRALLRANNGFEVDEGELEPLREAAERSRYRSAVSPEGRLTIEPARSDLSGFEARLLLALERVQSHGAWPRLKACTEESCQWAFYDTTRNGSRTWCSMDVCGNRAKTRRYRSRRSGT